MKNHIYKGKKTIRSLSRAVDYAVLVALVAILSLCAYCLWDSWQVYAAADASQYQQYKPIEKDIQSFEELRALNRDVIGWITIYDTGIDYPMVKPSKNNEEYMNLNPLREFTASGSVFLDVDSSSDFSDFNTILFGHHMSEHKMFGDIDLFLDEEFFDTHKYGNLFFEGENHGLEIVAISEISAGDKNVYQTRVTERKEYLSYIKKNAIHWRGASVNDRIVVMSTCSADVTNGRFILVGRILDHTVNDTFSKEMQSRTANLDQWIYRLWSLPLWQWIIFLIVLIILTYLAYRASKKRGIRK